MDSSIRYDIRKYKNGCELTIEDEVIVEYKLQLIINGKKFLSLLCTPRSLTELVAGFLFTEGIIQEMSDLGSVVIDEKAGIAEMTLSNKDTYTMVEDMLCGERTITTGCGRGHTITYPLVFEHKGCGKSVDYNPELILNLMNTFNIASDLFQATGGVHSCALCDDKILFLEEDIGRHNAMDKIIGHALMNQVRLEDKIVLTSGRVSSEIINKISKSGISTIVSRSAPTDQAIEIARSHGILLIGFARGQRMNIYN